MDERSRGAICGLAGGEKRLFHPSNRGAAFDIVYLSYSGHEYLDAVAKQIVKVPATERKDTDQRRLSMES